MATKKDLKPMPATQVKVFDIANRKGFAALCRLNLTEGTSPLQAYERMQKAVKRGGWLLEDLTAAQAKKLVKKTL